MSMQVQKDKTPPTQRDAGEHVKEKVISKSNAFRDWLKEPQLPSSAALSRCSNCSRCAMLA